MLRATANPDCSDEHNKLKRENLPPSMKNPEGEGNRKDGEGQRGELLQDGRGGTSGERAREQDRLERNKAKCSLFYFCEEHGDWSRYYSHPVND